MSTKGFTLEELAARTDSKVIGDASYCIFGVSDLESASSSEASFLANPRYLRVMQQSSAGAVFVAPNTPTISGRNFLINEDPSRAFQNVVELFCDETAACSGFEGVHPSAIIHETAQLESDVTVGPHAVIDKGVTIGNQSAIGAGCYIGPGTVIGKECLIHPNVTLRERCVLGNRVIIQPGAVIGSCGYGYTTNKHGHHEKLKQLGNVIIEDDVEVGANTTIDRARFTSTRIGRGTKIDNLVLIAHGVKVGEDNFIVGQAGIAGSARTGRHVILAGQTAIDGHLELDDGVVVAAKSGVSKSLKAGKYSGIPVQPVQEYNRNSVYLRNIGKYIKKIEELEQRLKELER